MNNLIRLLAFLLPAAPVAAQCPLQVLNCPASARSVCDTTPNNNGLWNEQFWWDVVHNQINLPEAPVDLCLKVADPCGLGNVGIQYALFLDLDGNGVWETAVQSDNFPGFNNIFFGNLNQPLGNPRAFDERPVLPNKKYGFALHKTTSGDTITACVRWNTAFTPNEYVLPELPYGKACVVWTITRDSAVLTCADTFTVKDCKNPVVVCVNNLSVNIMPTKTIVLWASDFLQYTEDNATPYQQITVGIRKSATGSGFPTNPDGTPQTGVIFDCNELGTNLIELWAKDKAGNAAYCDTYVIVQDNNYQCENQPPGGNLACVKSACLNLGMEGVYIEIKGNSPTLPPIVFGDNLTGPDGCLYLSGLPLSDDYTIAPVLDNDPLNGVSTFDLILINKHILGLEPLTNPYKLLAADANNSRSVTTFDIIELRKLILGVYQDFPNNTSWRFVPKDYVFPNPANPFIEVVPGSAGFTGVPLDFLGIKVGDINCNSVLNSFAPPPAEDRAIAAMALPDLVLAAGEVSEVYLQAPAAGEWLGAQFAVQFDPDKIEVDRVLPGALPGMDEQSFAHLPHGLVTASWFSAVPQKITAGTPLLRFRIRAKSAVWLSDALRLVREQLHAEVYTGEGRVQDLELLFCDPANSTSTQIFAPQPNPTGGAARIPVQLESELPVTLEIHDPAGRLLFREEYREGAGLFWIDIPAGVLIRAGVYAWRVRAGDAARAGRILRM